MTFFIQFIIVIIEQGLYQADFNIPQTYITYIISLKIIRMTMLTISETVLIALGYATLCQYSIEESIEGLMKHDRSRQTRID